MQINVIPQEQYELQNVYEQFFIGFIKSKIVSFELVNVSILPFIKAYAVGSSNTPVIKIAVVTKNITFLSFVKSVLLVFKIL